MKVPVVNEETFRARLRELESWLWLVPVPGVGRAPEIEKLAGQVLDLSDVYTVDRANLVTADLREHLAAKAFYFLCSDAPKVWCVLEELHRRAARGGGSGASRSLNSPLRVIDLGAGVGATSAGFLLSLDAQAMRTGPKDMEIELTGIDTDAAALAVWRTVASKAAEIAGVRVRLRSSVADALALPPELAQPPAAPVPPATPIVLAQGVLNELFHDKAEASAATSRAEWLARLAARSLVIAIEPALRETTRPLMAARDILARDEKVALLAPCPHRRACPMLPMERDWCHEVRPIEPTPRVAQVQALTRRRDIRTKFSFLAIAPASAQATAQVIGNGREADDRGTSAGETVLRGRLVSDTLNSKGKAERLICSSAGELVRLRLLDRERTESNALFADATRGERVEVAGTLNGARITSDIAVRKLD